MKQRRLVLTRDRVGSSHCTTRLHYGQLLFESEQSAAGPNETFRVESNYVRAGVLRVRYVPAPKRCFRVSTSSAWTPDGLSRGANSARTIGSHLLGMAVSERMS